MITIIVHWNDGDEEYTFYNKDDARMFCADSLSKCGNVSYSWKDDAQN